MQPLQCFPQDGKFIKFEGLEDSGLIVTFSLLSLGSQLMNDALSLSLTAELTAEWIIKVKGR